MRSTRPETPEKEDNRKGMKVQMSGDMLAFLKRFCRRFHSTKKPKEKRIFNLLLEVLLKYATSAMPSLELSGAQLLEKYPQIAGGHSYGINKDAQRLLNEFVGNSGLKSMYSESELGRSVLCNALFALAHSGLGIDGLSNHVYMHIRDRHKGHASQYYIPLPMGHYNAFEAAKKNGKLANPKGIVNYIGEILQAVRKMKQEDFDALIGAIGARATDYEMAKISDACYINVITDPKCKQRWLDGAPHVENLDAVFTTAAVIQLETDGVVVTN